MASLQISWACMCNYYYDQKRIVGTSQSRLEHNYLRGLLNVRYPLEESRRILLSIEPNVRERGPFGSREPS